MNMLMQYLYQQTAVSFSTLEALLKKLPPLELMTKQDLIHSLLNCPEMIELHSNLKNNTWETQSASFSERLKHHDIKPLFRWDPTFPDFLKNIPAPPTIIYYQGFLPPENHLSIAMVGARKATPVGCQVAREISTELAQSNVAIISGLAEGIDTASHEGALMGGGYTLAVLGCGLFKNYPASNLGLRRKILINGGGILSEFPPQMPSMSWNFPRRNRIISGLSEGVVIVEAGIKSGSLITAKYALDQNKDLFAIPGSLKNPVSQGPNRLIKAGATPVTEAQDILDHYSHAFLPIKKKSAPAPSLNSEEAAILMAIQHSNGISFDDLAMSTKLEASTLLSNLSTLEIYGLIERQITGDYLAL